jgi:hypothetical protein
MEGAEQAGPDDDSERNGAAPSRFSSETVTRKGMKQDTEPEPPSMVADFNHLLAEKREAVTCLPNLYKAGRREEAEPELRQAIALDPAHLRLIVISACFWRCTRNRRRLAPIS